MDSKRTRYTIIAPLGGIALASALMLSLPVAASAAGSAIAWTRQFGTSANDVATAIAVDAKRNVYVAGCTPGTLPNGNSKGNLDAFVRKIRPGGRTAWTRQFGTSGVDCAQAIGVDGRGRILVVGFTTGAFPGQTNKGGQDAFVRTFRPDGHTLRTRQFGTSGNDIASAIAFDSRDRILVAGRTTGAFSGKTNKGDEDAFVRTFRPDGRTLWTRQFGTSGFDTANAVAVDSRDRILVAGWTTGAFPGQTNKGGQDAFLRTFRPDGRTLRTRQFGTSGQDNANAVAVDSRDRTLVAGRTSGAFSGKTNKGDEDAYMRTLRPDGRTIRTRQFGTSGAEEALAIAVDSRNRILIAGLSDGAFSGQTNKGGGDAFVRAYRH